jgi:hypothetical protein
MFDKSKFQPTGPKALKNAQAPRNQPAAGAPTGRRMKSGGNVSSCGTKKMKAGGVMARVMNQKGKKK